MARRPAGDPDSDGEPTCRTLAVVAVLTLLAAGATRLRRSAARARDVPLSPLRGGWFVGPDYTERAGVAADETPAGEVDDLSVLARPDFDPDALDPEVRRFYERTGEYRLAYRTTWHRGFRLGAALAARLTGRVEQLNLPGPAATGQTRTLRSRFVGVDPAADPRRDARAWVRTDPDTGAAVFVAVYAVHESDGETFTNIAVPLPGGNLSTVLRATALDVGDAAPGMRLSTRGDGHPGLYLVTPLGPFALPMEQEFRVWSAGDDADASDGSGAPDASDAPGDPGDPDAPALRGVHEMWLLGRRFLSVDYDICRADG